MAIGENFGDEIKADRVIVKFNEVEHKMDKSTVKKGSSTHKIMSNTFYGNVICTIVYGIRTKVRKL
ncbi:MAG: hypothetical protein A7316_08795 [Candidatus Altiarchaeales archaeon WOR_SM1_86-2]|nr:MAG: hypothetical protein A7316_08795 [Candidatus Altiarchaeales archaeon WOR_SM1_86-2]